MFKIQPRWATWTSIVLLGLMGIIGTFNALTSIKTANDVLYAIGTLVLLYFLAYIPIKVLYEEVR